jgi:hypothetical protein
MMDELFAFICRHCGESVKVETKSSLGRRSFTMPHPCLFGTNNTVRAHSSTSSARVETTSSISETRFEGRRQYS